MAKAKGFTQSATKHTRNYKINALEQNSRQEQRQLRNCQQQSDIHQIGNQERCAALEDGFQRSLGKAGHYESYRRR